MDIRSLFLGSVLIILWLHPIISFSQQVKNVPRAFKALSSEPEIILVKNNMKVPTDGGHLQGVQVIEKNGNEKLLISGSSFTQAYILQVDLTSRSTDRLIPLMKEPFRHAGGIQVSVGYIVVGIEDNFAKTSSKVCLYSYFDADLYNAQPIITINRKGVVKRHTAGATGLLAIDNGYLVVVSNWDSRNWDFYHIDLERNEQKIIESFVAPDDWAAYQSINLIMDEHAIYAVGFYKKEPLGYADLILVSKRGTFELIMKKVLSKAFYCINGVDFATAAGLEVDKAGNLHIWGTQRDAVEQIAVNKFSQQ